MNLKIRIAEEKNFNLGVLTFLKQFAEVEIAKCTKEELPFIFDNYDVFWFRLGFKIEEKLILSSKRVRIIATPVTGIDHIDEIACINKGIKIVCLRGEHEFLKEIRATAEHTIGLTLSLMRFVPDAINDTKLGNWNRDLFRGNEIYKKNVGIVGMGRLGKITSFYFNALGASVFYYDLKDIECDYAQKVNSLLDLNEMDVVCIHVNLTVNSRNIINENFFLGCNPNMFLINTSRGGIVDENALYSALLNNKIKGAALDVLQNEFEFNSNNELLNYSKSNNNLIITPHIGGNTFESFEKTELFIAEKIYQLFNPLNEE